MRNHSILFLILLLFAACGEPEQRPLKEPDTIVPQPKKKDTVVPVAPPATLQLDTMHFKKSFDSLLTLILGKPIVSRLVVDTVSKNRYYPFIDSAQLTVRYRFHTPSPDRMMSIWIYESFYTDTLMADRRFKFTRKLGGSETLGDFTRPAPAGLSYAIDYAVRNGNKIILLNAPCPYSDKSFRRLLPVFKRNIGGVMPDDSLSCNCGTYCD